MADPKNPIYEKFLKEHLPKVPDFVETNRPKFDPGFTLGPPVRGAHEKNMLEFYYQNDVRHIVADMLARPEHYTQEQQAIIDAIAKKRPLPQGAGNREINEIVMRFLESSDHRKEREKVIQKAQRKVEPKDPKSEEDPTIARLLENAKNPTFENQEAMPKFIKII